MNSIRKKTSNSFYLLAALSIFLSLFAFINLLYLQKQVKEGVVISNFKDDILEMRRHEKNLLLYHNKKELENIILFTKKAINNLKTNQATYQKLQANIDLDTLINSIKNYQHILEKYWNDWENLHQERMLKKIRPLGHQLSSIADKLAAREREYLLTSLSTAQWTLVIAIVVTTLIISVIGYRLSLLVVKPLRELENNLAPIANGQFDQLKINSDEQEVIAFTDAFNSMLYELDLRKKKLSHTEKLASLGILVSGVAHELNNPLGNILSSCQLLKEDLHSADPELLTDWLNQIDSETMRAHKIVSALKDFGRQSDFKIQIISLLELIDTTLLLLQNDLKKLPPIIKDIPQDLLINVDPHKFQQIIINLIKNAIDAGDSTNQIRIKANYCFNNSSKPSVREKIYQQKAYIVGEVKVSPKSDSSFASLSISDTGHGIAKDKIENIFDPFFTTKPPGKGMGLGLYLVQEIIRDHQGEIGVISGTGDGTQFIIRLPCSTV